MKPSEWKANIDTSPWALRKASQAAPSRPFDTRHDRLHHGESETANPWRDAKETPTETQPPPITDEVAGNRTLKERVIDLLGKNADGQQSSKHWNSPDKGEGSTIMKPVKTESNSSGTPPPKRTPRRKTASAPAKKTTPEKKEQPSAGPKEKKEPPLKEIPVEDVLNGIINALGNGLGHVIDTGKSATSRIPSALNAGLGAVGGLLGGISSRKKNKE